MHQSRSIIDSPPHARMRIETGTTLGVHLHVCVNVKTAKTKGKNHLFMSQSPPSHAGYRSRPYEDRSKPDPVHASVHACERTTHVSAQNKAPTNDASVPQHHRLPPTRPHENRNWYYPGRTPTRVCECKSGEKREGNSPVNDIIKPIGIRCWRSRLPIRKTRTVVYHPYI